MDYARIYAEFIRDRRGKEPGPGQYSESHHILPRSLGGGDEPENLVRLTPEDHFFAHLLLAKIHGGDMWAPVAFMVGGSRKHWKPTVSRKNHGWAARAMAKARSGVGAYQYDKEIRLLTHKSGRQWRGTQAQMHTDLGMSKPLANLLVRGKVNSGRGWSIGPKYISRPSGSEHHMYRAEVHRFVHKDGREFVGTQFEFHKACGIRKPDACRLARGQYKVSQGWRIED